MFQENKAEEESPALRIAYAKRHGLRKENLKRETESLSIPAQINAIWNHQVKVKIYNTQENCMRRLYRKRDETIKHIRSNCSKQ